MSLTLNAHQDQPTLESITRLYSPIITKATEDSLAYLLQFSTNPKFYQATLGRYALKKCDISEVRGEMMGSFAYAFQRKCQKLSAKIVKSFDVSSYIPELIERISRINQVDSADAIDLLHHQLCKMQPLREYFKIHCGIYQVWQKTITQQLADAIIEKEIPKIARAFVACIEPDSSKHEALLRNPETFRGMSDRISFDS